MPTQCFLGLQDHQIHFYNVTPITFLGASSTQDTSSTQYFAKILTLPKFPALYYTPIHAHVYAHALAHTKSTEQFMDIILHLNKAPSQTRNPAAGTHSTPPFFASTKTPPPQEHRDPHSHTQKYSFIHPRIYHVNQGLASFFCNRSDSKYIGLCLAQLCYHSLNITTDSL